jgi:glycosyltransferase involved in cell wall biosynthesis
VRVVALLATHNEERFIGGCIEHLHAHGVSVYLIDNDSTDRTADIAESRRGRGVIGVESLQRDGVFRLGEVLERKSEVARFLAADWFIHLDADEIRLPPRPSISLAEAFAKVGRRGYNAVNFQEFTFVPTRESPDHDHSDFQGTMRWYYPFAPKDRHHVTAWKNRAQPVDLASSGGHRVAFEGRRVCPRSFPMKHYLYLSRAQAVRKYVNRRYDEREVAKGWGRERARLRVGDIGFLGQAELSESRGDADLDPSRPLKRHPLFAGPEAQLG